MSQRNKLRIHRHMNNYHLLLLALLTSFLLFLLTHLVLRSALYAVLLFLLAIIPFSIYTTGVLWRLAATASLTVPFFLLERLLHPTSPFTPQLRFFVVFSLMLCACLTGGTYWRVRTERNAFWEQRDRERSISELSASLLTAMNRNELFSLTLRSVFSCVDCPAVLYVPDAHGEPVRAASYPEGLLLYPAEDVVSACFASSAPAGRGTGLCADNPLFCLPVRGNERVVAVLGLLLNANPDTCRPQLQTVNSLILRSGIAMERLLFLEREQTILMEKEKERIRSDFLRSISHDLRTPLTGIIGACSALQQDNVALSERNRKDLLFSISEEASWLLRMVENLLSVTRVGSVDPKLNITEEPLEEVLSAVLEKSRSRFPNTEIRFQPLDGCPMILMDPILIVQVLMNLIDNAVKYAGADCPIDLWVEEHDAQVAISVRDHGGGLSRRELSTLFEPAAQRSGDSGHGMGLGLSLCKSIISAHNGSITGRNSEDGGAVFTITLPRATEVEDE